MQKKNGVKQKLLIGKTYILAGKICKWQLKSKRNMKEKG